MKEELAAPGPQGGLEAEVVDVHAEERRWREEANPLPSNDANYEHLAKMDLKGIRKGLRVSALRRACPNWSLPTAVWTIVPMPNIIRLAGTAKGILLHGERNISVPPGRRATEPQRHRATGPQGHQSHRATEP